MSTAIDDVKSRADLVEIIGRTVQLKKSGSTYKGLCPFHQEKTPSFYVSQQYQNWNCFGCYRHGDVFDFIGERDGTEFSEVLRTLAHEVGVQLPEHGSQSDRERKQQLYEIMNAAADLYQVMLHNDRLGGDRARAYLEQRGVDEFTVKDFGLGWAPRGDCLLTSLVEHYKLEGLYRAGLIRGTEEGLTYDFFHSRIIIPIRDKTGRTIAFGGRSLTPNNQNTPKYLNSPETLIFRKQDVLYGLDRAKAEITQKRTAVIVEGYFDVMAAHAHGQQNTVATLGTSVSVSHLTQLKKDADTIVLAMDSDAAGMTATWRALPIADQSLREGVSPVLGPNRRHQTYMPGRASHLKIAHLTGKDPDEILRANPKEWAALVSQAVPVIDFVLNQIKNRYDLRSGAEKADAAAEVAEVLSGVANPVERAHYIQQAAELLEVDKSDIRELIIDQGVIRLNTPEKPDETDGDVEWDIYALALYRLSWGMAPGELRELPLLSSQGRAFIKDRIENPGAYVPVELEEFLERVMGRLDSLSLVGPASIKMRFREATATLRRRAALRERAALVSALRDAESDDEKTQLVGALNQWKV